MGAADRRDRGRRRRVDAWIDTGGDALTLPALRFGVEPLARFAGASYAGGEPGEGVYGKVASVRLGPVTVRDVPVATAGLERPVIGTGFLSRFLPTLDYPAGRLRPAPARDRAAAAASRCRSRWRHAPDGRPRVARRPRAA